MTPSVSRSVLVDITQYVNWPAASGVQRALLHLAREWPEGSIDASFGFMQGDDYVIGPVSELAPVIASVFRAANAGDSLPDVRGALRGAATDVISASEIEQSFDAYLLPEPTLQHGNLVVARALRDSTNTVAFFLYYDSLPLTHPEFFSRRADDDAAVTLYHQVVARSDNVAFISRSSKALFEQRLARRKLRNAVVIRLGADGLPSVREARRERPTFAMLGTVEPRKQYPLVLEAFERLWSAGRDYRLVVLGARGGEAPAFVERLRELAVTPRVRWIERPDDEEVANALAQSWALVFASRAEGYGLPPTEALAAGCPVIVVEDLPALEDLPPAGQIRLSTAAPEAVAEAIETLADPTTNAAYRDAAGTLRLPTWSQFAEEVVRWITSTVSRLGPPREASASLIPT